MYSSFKIVQPVMQRAKYFPDYLLKNMENYKNKNAEYPLTKDDDNATEFLKLVHDKKYIVKNEVKAIHRVKRGSKEYLCYSMNLLAFDEDDNKAAEFYHVYGWNIHPLIKSIVDRGQEKLVPDGYKIEHEIPFSAKAVENALKLCHPDYKENVWFIYSEVPLDSKVPVKESRTQLIKSEEIFKNATNAEIQKIVKKGLNEIEDLRQLDILPAIKTNIK
jgi:hypothetical protein